MTWNLGVAVVIREVVSAKHSVLGTARRRQTASRCSTGRPSVKDRLNRESHQEFSDLPRTS